MTEVKALYIHIPFCISKCKYCDFFSVPCRSVQPLVPDDYVDSLCNEIVYRIKQFNIKKLESIYIGGGTPSLLNELQLCSIFSAIRKNLLINDDCEITIESNPDDITPDLIKTWSNIGINRISLGIQSFSDNALSFVSRRASADVNRHALNIIRENWHKELSVDLICGLPGQKKESFIEDLNYLTEYKPDHISMYSLTIEEETPLGKEFYSGKLKYDFDMADDIWLLGREILEKNGYIHYEVSNFCLQGKECSHNLKYWNHESYVGCGSGGAGTVYNDDGSGNRWTNINNIKKYTDFWKNVNKSSLDIELPELKENVDVDTSVFEFFMMGLRKISGVKESDFVNIFKKPVPENIIETFCHWEEKGLCKIECKKDCINYTLGHEGILYLNSFLEEII